MATPHGEDIRYGGYVCFDKVAEGRTEMIPGQPPHTEKIYNKGNDVKIQSSKTPDDALKWKKFQPVDFISRPEFHLT